NLDTAEYATAEWPAEWNVLRKRFESRLRGAPGGPGGPAPDNLFELPRFRGGPPTPGIPGEAEWIVAELDMDYVRNTALPQWINRSLPDYHARVVSFSNPSDVIYDSAPSLERSEPDASVALLDIRPFGFGGRGGRGMG